MLWAMRGLSLHSPWFQVAYAHAPRRWVGISTVHREPQRFMYPRP